MNMEFKVGNPFDYSEDRYNVYFEVASKENAFEVIRQTGLSSEIGEVEFGFIVKIARQQIPEIVRELANENIAIYAVVPGNQV